MWDALASGRPFTPRTQIQREAVERYNDVMLCNRFKWTAEDIARTPQDFYEDAILITNIKDAKDNPKKPK